MAELLSALPTVHPALPMLLGALLLPLLRGRARAALFVALPLLSMVNLAGLELGAEGQLQFAGWELEPLRYDRLARVFTWLFHLAALAAAIYSLHVDDAVQLVSGLMYAASAVGVVLAGDLLTLFVFWELLAITSVFQVWARRTPESLRSGMRYLLWHVSSGLLLFAGAAAQWREESSLAFGSLVGSDGVPVGLAAWLIFAAIGIKCSFPLLHTWVVDAYPAATPTGAVFLASFTTKVAVYTLARGFAGFEALIWIGAAMAMFPIFYAVIENDLRRVLGYSMINQIGYMVVGVGIGTAMSLNGTVSHAFAHIFYKALLYMAMGAVLLRTGRINGSELGGLYKTMPWTAGFCIVGAASISAFPLFSGFISKSMVLSEAAHTGYVAVWLMLLFASAGVFHHAGIKIPYFAFYAHDSGLRPQEAPINMRVGMGLAAGLCIFLGCFPQFLYAALPYPVDYVPYTASHVVQQLQLLFFSALAFTVLTLTRIYPPELRSVNLDADWLWRRLLPATASAFQRAGAALGEAVTSSARGVLLRAGENLRTLYSPSGRLGEPWPTGTTALWVAVILGLYLLVSFWYGV